MIPQSPLKVHPCDPVLGPTPIHSTIRKLTSGDSVLSSTPKHPSISWWYSPQHPGISTWIFGEYSGCKLQHPCFLLFPVLENRGIGVEELCSEQRGDCVAWGHSRSPFLIGRSREEECQTSEDLAVLCVSWEFFTLESSYLLYFASWVPWQLQFHVCSHSTWKVVVGGDWVCFLDLPRSTKSLWAVRQNPM